MLIFTIPIHIKQFLTRQKHSNSKVHTTLSQLTVLPCDINTSHCTVFLRWNSVLPQVVFVVTLDYIHNHQFSLIPIVKAKRCNHRKITYTRVNFALTPIAQSKRYTHRLSTTPTTVSTTHRAQITTMQVTCTRDIQFKDAIPNTFEICCTYVETPSNLNE
jgi:hypothetical protein